MHLLNGMCSTAHNDWRPMPRLKMRSNALADPKGGDHGKTMQETNTALEKARASLARKDAKIKLLEALVQRMKSETQAHP